MRGNNIFTFNVNHLKTDKYFLCLFIKLYSLNIIINNFIIIIFIIVIYYYIGLGPHKDIYKMLLYYLKITHNIFIIVW